MYDPGNPVWDTVSLGPMPVAVLARIGIDADAGEVVLFHHAMKHAFGKIPARRAICWPYLAHAVCNPTHIGQQPKYAGVAFDVVHAAGNGTIVLVSVLLKPTKRFPTKYAVTSAYPIDRNTLERRIRLGTTIVL